MFDFKSFNAHFIYPIQAGYRYRPTIMCRIRHTLWFRRTNLPEDPPAEHRTYSISAMPFFVFVILCYLLHSVICITILYSIIHKPSLTHWGRGKMDAIFKCIFVNENVWIPFQISLKFVPISNIPALVQIMAWSRPGDKPLSEPMMGSLTTHICVTRPQWVNKGMFCCILCQ